MSKFWQKKYISKYTGAEIDAAIAAGSQVPEIDIEDAGKILGVDNTGKIEAISNPILIIELLATIDSQTERIILISKNTYTQDEIFNQNKIILFYANTDYPGLGVAHSVSIVTASAVDLNTLTAVTNDTNGPIIINFTYSEADNKIHGTQSLS